MNLWLAPITLFVLALLVLWLLVRWQRSHPEFDLADLLTGDNGKVSLAKFGQAAALVVSTWGSLCWCSRGSSPSFISSAT